MRLVSWQRLSTQVVIMQVAILVVTMVAGFGIFQWNLKRQLYGQYEQRSLMLAQTLASQPSIIDAVVHGLPGGEAQRLAMAARHRTGALFVVITNAEGIRYSHPHPWMIGLPVQDDPEPPASESFRTGKSWMGIQEGTLGAVAAGKTPLKYQGKLAGEVSVGFSVAKVSQQLASTLPSLAIYLLGVLAVGVLAALGLARRLKRQTFGLELGEIAGLLQEREAMLHGIREAVLGYDRGERVILANDAARRLLRLPPDFLGRPLQELLPPGRLGDIVRGEISGSDLLVLADDRVLVVNRMPIELEHRRHLGWVVTFHDQTESETLKRELDEAIGLTEALRAQSHEFANRMHTLVGLVELGQYGEAIRFVTDVSAARDALTEQLKAGIRDPKLVALTLAKSSLAEERGVQLRVAADCHVDADLTDVTAVLTVAGNLIDNAIEATAQVPGPRWVELTVVSAGENLMIRVRDSGPGVPDDMREAIFTDGFTSKSSPTGARRGLGLALVWQITERRGGMVSVGRDGGAVFTAVLPGCLDVPPVSGSAPGADPLARPAGPAALPAGQAAP
ncbi:MAG: two-component system, CitB family, sensor kinase [Streptosporangiaceae bacterium]|jgi:two-component system CitB family sensor kinase|nr:two-component system, CitB family, sensor kinase [Streptosporangiaceae bacterium]